MVRHTWLLGSLLLGCATEVLPSEDKSLGSGELDESSPMTSALSWRLRFETSAAVDGVAMVAPIIEGFDAALGKRAELRLETDAPLEPDYSAPISYRVHVREMDAEAEATLSAELDPASGEISGFGDAPAWAEALFRDFLTVAESTLQNAPDVQVASLDGAVEQSRTRCDQLAEDIPLTEDLSTNAARIGVSTCLVGLAACVGAAAYAPPLVLWACGAAAVCANVLWVISLSCLTNLVLEQ